MAAKPEAKEAPDKAAPDKGAAADKAAPEKGAAPAAPRFAGLKAWLPVVFAVLAAPAASWAVAEYVLGQPGAQEFIAAYEKAVTIALEGYQRENKSHSTIAIGCTGGKHRSVATAIELARRLSTHPGLAVRLKHRDRGRE